MIFPGRHNIVSLNKGHIDSTGGRWLPPENLFNEDGLEWVLHSMRYPLFGFDPYPTLSQKAVLLAWTIIVDHVFNDGCKRTAMAALEIMLLTNRYKLTATDREIKDVALLIADHSINGYIQTEFLEWVRKNMSIVLTP